MSDLTKWHRASSCEAFKRKLGALRYLFLWYWDALLRMLPVLYMREQLNFCDGHHRFVVMGMLLLVSVLPCSGGCAFLVRCRIPFHCLFSSAVKKPKAMHY